MISADSRYNNVPVTIVDTPQGKRQVLGIEPAQERSFEFTYYQVQEEETVDGIAHDEFGDGSLWWLIANANPEILDWHVLAPGTILRIPNA